MADRASRDSIIGGANGDDDELGRKLEACKLGPDCPFEPALKRLQLEQHERINSEAALASALDAVANKAQAVYLQLEAFERKWRDLSHDFERHIKQHRYLELAVISVGAALGGFLGKLIVH